MADDLQALRQQGREIAELARSIRELAGDDDLAFADTLDGETNALRAASGAVRVVAAMEAMESAAKALSGRYGARAQDFADRAQRARNAIVQFMGDIGEKTLVLPEATLSLANGGQVLVGEPDVAKLPLALVISPPPKPDRAAIKQHLQAGGSIEGCSLSNGPPSLRIRTR